MPSRIASTPFELSRLENGCLDLKTEVWSDLFLFQDYFEALSSCSRPINLLRDQAILLDDRLSYWDSYSGWDQVGGVNIWESNLRLDTVFKDSDFRFVSSLEGLADSLVRVKTSLLNEFLENFSFLCRYRKTESYDLLLSYEDKCDEAVIIYLALCDKDANNLFSQNLARLKKKPLPRGFSRIDNYIAGYHNSMVRRVGIDNRLSELSSQYENFNLNSDNTAINIFRKELSRVMRACSKIHYYHGLHEVRALLLKIEEEMTQEENFILQYDPQSIELPFQSYSDLEKPKKVQMGLMSLPSDSRIVNLYWILEGKAGYSTWPERMGALDKEISKFGDSQEPLLVSSLVDFRDQLVDWYHKGPIRTYINCYGLNTSCVEKTIRSIDSYLGFCTS